jgi:serine/threonine-protein kinase
MAELETGTLIDGRYRVLERLGSGGMADVFLAEDQQLGRKVALKLLHRRFSEDPGFVERFRREAQAAAGLQHPNVVSVYDRGAYDGTYYIAMEYLPGRSLKQLIRQEAPLDPIRAIDITIQILKAARFAHRHGVIHRDLKPHNVIVDDSGHVKVTDFGIARAGASDMTETGSIMGTAQYLSPEQAQGHAVSASSDLYSIGVVLYEMLTGRVPFDAEAAVTIALKHVSEPPTAPTAVNAAVPPALEHVVLWALNKNPADRPQDADQFIAALEAARSAIISGERGQNTASMAALAGVAGAAGAGGLAAAALAGVAGGGAVGTAPPPGVPQANGDGIAAYVLTRPHDKTVPAVIGDSLNTARTIIKNDGFGVSTVDESNTKPPGIVIGEIPNGGSKVKAGSTISLAVSTGPGTASVPPVIGLSLRQARRAIIQAGLTVGRIVYQHSNIYANGLVSDTNPAAAQMPAKGSPVTVFVSSGPANVNVPDVTGDSESQAKSTLEAAGFKVTPTPQTSTTTPVGHVISQIPGGNTPAPPGSTVNIVIAKASTTASVPNVKGQSAAAATQALRSAGFTVAQTTKNVTNQSKNGIVLRQTPKSGASAKKGSTVTIVVGKYTAPTSTTPTTTTPTTTTPTTTPTTTTPTTP